ncbi:MAG TPA: HAMP domain-containing sensor histidine kinase [Steroidobacteraceae bacterium]|nr:HAMP domain-containing sensor histidine kinase [Steroidobacteraceae bacterium]
MNEPAGQGTLSVLPGRRARWVAALAAVWIVVLVTLIGWWATLVLRQAALIADLQAQSGSVSAALAQWSRTRLMLIGESSVFLALLLTLTVVLVWFYWRESRRTRGMQAFFASVTHELRTPLTSIRLQAEAIAEGAQSTELARRLLEDSHRLESQIDKTLELARIEGGGPLSEQSIPLQGWLERALGGIAAAHGARLQWQCEVAPELPAVLADAAALQMILRNLVENSVRHAGVEPVLVTLQASVQEGGVRLAYRDNGQGLRARDAKLGLMFGRGPASTGVGVGLYLVRRLMQRMGGRVVFDTAPQGQGFGVDLWFRASTD